MTLIIKQHPLSPSTNTLQYLNQFLPHEKSPDTYLHLQKVMDIILTDPKSDYSHDNAIETLTQLLLEIQGSQQNQYSYHYCNLSQLEVLDILWIHHLLLNSIKNIIGTPKSILVIYGLKKLLHKKSPKHPTHKNLQTYSEYTQYCEEFIANKIPSTTQLKIIFI